MCDTVYSRDEIGQRIRPVAKKHNLKKVYLFGSYARGTANSASDVDFLIEASEAIGLFTLGGLYTDLEEALGKSCDLVTVGALRRQEKTDFAGNVRKDCVLIYEE